MRDKKWSPQRKTGTVVMTCLLRARTRLVEGGGGSVIDSYGTMVEWWLKGEHDDTGREISSSAISSPTILIMKLPRIERWGKRVRSQRLKAWPTSSTFQLLQNFNVWKFFCKLICKTVQLLCCRMNDRNCRGEIISKRCVVLVFGWPQKSMHCI